MARYRIVDRLSTWPKQVIQSTMNIEKTLADSLLSKAI